MQASKELFLDYRSLLFSTAYNMLGSVEDAEDMVQEAYLKWLELDEVEVRHIKAYLVRLVVNKCINYLESARVKREEYIGTWLPEALPDEGYSERHILAESYHALSIGVLLLLEKLSPIERGIFILREVFAYDYHELSEIFEKSEDHCRQIFKRAKESLGKKGRRFEVDREAHQAVLDNFIDASSRGNLNDLIALFKEEIALFADGGGKSLTINGLKLTAIHKPLHGREAIGKFLLGVMSKLQTSVPELQNTGVSVNGLPSFVSYVHGRPLSLVSIESEEGKISRIYIQTNPDKLKLFHT